MSNAFKAVVTSTVSEEVARVGYNLPDGASEVVEAVADRLADHVEQKAQSLVEQVEDRYSSYEAGFATDVLTEAGFLSGPEPEPEPVVAEPSDEEAPGWFKSFADGITSRLGTLEDVARRRGLL